MSGFVHLHVHTTYSLLDGQCPVNALVERARKWNMPALAVTDHGNLFALKAFYDACRAKEKNFKGLPPIKPILGCEAYVTSNGDYLQRDKTERRHHLILLAKNLTGYHNLVRLISEAHIHGFYYHARIDHKLLERYHEGLICSSACLAGEIAWAIGQGRMDVAESTAAWYKNLFGDDYYLEVMEHKSDKPERLGLRLTGEQAADIREVYARQVKVTQGVIELGRKLDIPIIATNDVHFLEKEDDDSHDVLLCLSTGKKLSDPGRMIYTGEEWFKDEESMAAIFPDHPEFLENTVKLAEKVEEYNLNSKPIMPKFPIPAAFGSEADAKYAAFEDPAQKRIQFEADYLDHLVWEGAHRRWGDELPESTKERVAFELETIRKMGFPGYFLIVHDYIKAARDMGVWVGPGRGSAAGAAVAYALGITNVDPLKFDLLFERFLNPDRISMPDIDVDFDDDGRGRVLEYVTQKYGQDHVAHIVTFGQMAPKSAIKDVGRVMEYPLADTNKLAGLVPDEPKVTFKKALGKNKTTGAWNYPEGPQLKDALEGVNVPDVVAPGNEEIVKTLMERAVRLDGSIRQPGVHACGVIISRDPLIDTLPVMPTEGESLLTTQYDGHFVEPVGLLKMDFLGLKTLSVEKECLALIRKFRKKEDLTDDAFGRTLDTDQIPDDDAETYKLFGRGETTGLFQFESDGMKKWLIALQPERLTDLVAMNALYRPGPMDYIPSFVARKQGTEPITYDHPLMEEHLKDTYGVTVYQEQVMLLSRKLAGFTRGDSDKLRKAMGKKLMDIMNQLKAQFIEGCLANPEFRVGEWKDEAAAKKLIEKIWIDWEKFASYAFNKSHAVCYAWVAYQTGYLKTHYPEEFMCAQISSEIGNFDKLPGFVAEADSMGIEVRPPDVNSGFPRFTPVGGGVKAIRYGLAGIKGVGGPAAEAIVAEREANGPYTCFTQFVRRTAEYCAREGKGNLVNKRALESLVRTGACDTFGLHRRRMLVAIDDVIKRAAVRVKELASKQTDFFADLNMGSDSDSDADLIDCPPRPVSEDYKDERDLLGIYMTGHPLGAYRKVLAHLSTVKLADFPEGVMAQRVDTAEKDWRGKRKCDVRVAAMLTACRVMQPKVPVDSRGNPKPPWAILSLDDETGTLDVYAFGKTFSEYGFLKDVVDQPILICGEVAHRSHKTDQMDERGRPVYEDDEELQLIVREAYPLSEGIRGFGKKIVATLAYDDPKVREKARAIRDLSTRFPGTVPLALDLIYPSGAHVDVDLKGCTVSSDAELFVALKRLAPEHSLRTTGTIYLKPPDPPMGRHR